ncbi:MAG: ribosomal protein S18-alanine N-acetyltransferase [Dehalococcoidia bacterium]
MVQSAMAFTVRPMKPSDMKQVLEVERNAFPTLWPPTPFKRELRNKLAKYIVAIQERPSIVSLQRGSNGQGLAGDSTVGVALGPRSNGGWRWWTAGLRRLLPSGMGVDFSNHDFIVGYLGMWFMVEDAHIVAVGVKEPRRRQGVGELLIIRSIEIASEWGARYITLEVRVSNKAAQTLYEKYGFKIEGVRKRYYSDDQEDAYIMTTDAIGTEGYQREFQHLKRLHIEKWGEPLPAKG